ILQPLSLSLSLCLFLSLSTPLSESTSIKHYNTTTLLFSVLRETQATAQCFQYHSVSWSECVCVRVCVYVCGVGVCVWGCVGVCGVCVPGCVWCLCVHSV